MSTEGSPKQEEQLTEKKKEKKEKHRELLIPEPNRFARYKKDMRRALSMGPMHEPEPHHLEEKKTKVRKKR